MKKAELSINVVVIASIAVIILVILVYLVLDALGVIKPATSCEGKQGVCISDYYNSCDEYFESSDRTYVRDMGSKCDQNMICCMPVG